MTLKNSEIAEIAAELFAEYGYRGTSMMDIAQKAGVSKSLIYHYFSKKEDILFQVMHQHLTELYQALLLKGNLAEMISETLKQYSKARAAHKIQLNELKNLDVQNQKEIIKLNRAIRDIFAQEIAKFYPFERKRLIPLTMLLLGMINWHEQWFHDGQGLSREQLSQMIYEIFTKGILGYRG